LKDLPIVEAKTSEKYLYIDLPRKLENIPNEDIGISFPNRILYVQKDEGGELKKLMDVKAHSKKNIFDLIVDPSGLMQFTCHLSIRTASMVLQIPVIVNVLPFTLNFFPKILDFGIFIKPTEVF